MAVTNLYQTPIKKCVKCQTGYMYFDGIRNDLYCTYCRTREAVVGDLNRPRGSPGVITSEEARMIATFVHNLGIRQVARITGHSRNTIKKIYRSLK